MDFSILDIIPASTFILNQRDEIVFVSGEAKRFEEMVNQRFVPGLHFLDIVRDEIREMVKATLMRVRLTKERTLLESSYQDRKGKVSHFETAFSLFSDEHGQSEMICVIFREITGEKVFQKKVTQLLQEFSSMIENANAVIFSVDSREYITEWNAECARITMFTRNESLARKLDTFIDDSGRNELRLFLDFVFKGAPGSNFELRFKTKSEGTVNVLVNATPKINNEGRVVGVLFVGHDVTELSEYRKSLERIVMDRTEKLKEALGKEKELLDIRNRFVSMASHELRIPLSMIASSAQHIRSKIHDSDSVEKLNTIESQIAHMRSLIDDVLTLGKTEVPKIKASRQKLDIIAFIAKLSGEVVINAQHSHKVVFVTSHPVVEIESDEKLLRNVFLNLLSNAIKFSPSHHEIYVDITSVPRAIVIKVIDKGMGIPEADLSRVFEPFSRGTNASEVKGTGLGLSIVKRAIEVLGGSISVESVVNEGTTVTVRFSTLL